MKALTAGESVGPSKPKSKSKGKEKSVSFGTYTHFGAESHDWSGVQQKATRGWRDL